MNIKSLLLGSAAALAVVSGAQAADAVVAAEPEPMEYVKVCDAYGTGFFYIPGTETCLKIGGQFRYEKRWSTTDGSASAYSQWSRGRIEIEAKNDSEWGTVYSWIRIEGSHKNNVGSTSTLTDSAGDTTDTYSSQNIGWAYYFGIGGLEFGKFDSQWVKFMGYGGRTDDGGVYTSDWDITARQYMSYSMDFGAASAFISLDHDAEYGELTGRKYMPDVSAGVKAKVGDYEVAAAVGYDESDESFAVKKVVRGDIDMFGFTLMGLYSNSASNTYFSYDGFSVIAGVSAKVTDTITLAKDFQYWDNGDWRIVGDVNWAVASGFSVLLEASYADFSGTKTKGGFLRFQRSF